MKLRTRWRPPQPPTLLARQEIPTGIPSDINTEAPAEAPSARSSKPTVTSTSAVKDATVTKTLDAITVTKTNHETSVETDRAPPIESGGAAKTTGLPESSDNSNGGGGFSGGAIAGIVVSVGALLVLIAAFLLWRRRRQKKLISVNSPHEQAGVAYDNILDTARWNGGVAQLDTSGGIIAEVDGEGGGRGPSELPGSSLARTPNAGLAGPDGPGLRATLNSTEGGRDGAYVNSWSSYRA